MGGTGNAATTNIDGSSNTNGITFNSGTLQAASGGITTGKTVVVGATGGTIDTNGNGVTLSGWLAHSFCRCGRFRRFRRDGRLRAYQKPAGTLTLSNVANTFGGGLIINNGTVLDAATTGVAYFCTGYVTFGASNTPTLDLGGHSATVAGLIGAGSNGVVTNSVAATTSTLTLDGVYGETYAVPFRTAAARWPLRKT